MSYETVCTKIKLKADSLGQVREWANTMNARKEEVLATLRDETVIVEAAFLDQTSEGDFLIVFMKAESLAKAGEAVKSPTHEIDKIHQKFKHETWEERKSLELLVDLDRIAEI
jgi:uncharacterized protein DUF6176